MAVTIEGRIGSYSGDYSAAWGYLGPTLPAILNLLSATPDGCRGLVLAFDRPPDGPITVAGTYTLAALDGGTLPAIATATVEPDAPHAPYSWKIRLTFATPGTATKLYSVTVAGLTGASGEALGTASASWAAPTPSAVTVLAAYAEAITAILVGVSQDLIGNPALTNPATYTITTADPTADPYTVIGAALAPGSVRQVRVFATGGTPGRLYTITVGISTLVSVDGGTVGAGSRSATFQAASATPAPWLPPGLMVTLGDGAPFGDQILGLLPEDGEPSGAVLVRCVWLSLVCRRRAGPDDALPDEFGDPPDRGGWFSDSLAVPGDLWGSRLWLLYRARGDDVPARAEEYVLEALAWLKVDGLASGVACEAAPNGNRLDMDVTITRPTPGANPVRLRWDLWGGL